MKRRSLRFRLTFLFTLIVGMGISIPITAIVALVILFGGYNVLMCVLCIFVCVFVYATIETLYLCWKLRKQ